jgi:hypothetical protein
MEQHYYDGQGEAQILASRMRSMVLVTQTVRGLPPSYRLKMHRLTISTVFIL